MKRIIHGIMLALLLLGFLMMAYRVQSLNAESPRTETHGICRLNSPEDSNTTERIDLSPYVSMSWEYDADYVRLVVSTRNPFSYTVYNVTEDFDVTLNDSITHVNETTQIDSIDPSATNIRKYLSAWTYIQYFDNMTLIDAYGYENLLSLSLSVSTTTVVIGQSTSVNGSITPVLAGVNVTLWYMPNYPSYWEPLANVTTDENGNYSYEWTPALGSYQLKANNTGDENDFPTESSTIALNCVEIATSISISTSSSSTVLGYSVSISGTLSDQYGNGLADEPVILYYTSYGVNSWTLITSVASDEFGNYSAMWIPSATGTFTIEAAWNGNATDAAASSNVTLSSLPYLNQYVFSVESNSTVSDLAFNTTNSELSFTVSGPSGTVGYVKMAVAKSLVPNVTDLSVYIDGNQTDFTASSTDDSWILYFTYTHSTHMVTVALGNSTVPEFPTLLILPLFLITTLIAVVLCKEKIIAQKALCRLKYQRQKS